jgi:hypothetical protein
MTAGYAALRFRFLSGELSTLSYARRGTSIRSVPAVGAFLKHEFPRCAKSLTRRCLPAFAKASPASAAVSNTSAQTARFFPQAAAGLHRPSRTGNRNQRCIASIYRISSWPHSQLYSGLDGNRIINIIQPRWAVSRLISVLLLYY